MKKMIYAALSVLLIGGMFAGCGNGHVGSSSAASDGNIMDEVASVVSKAESELVPPIINSAISDVESAIHPNSSQGASSTATSSVLP